MKLKNNFDLSLLKLQEYWRKLLENNPLLNPPAYPACQPKILYS